VGLTSARPFSLAHWLNFDIIGSGAVARESQENHTFQFGGHQQIQINLKSPADSFLFYFHD
jgi:hypothetical protein